VDATRTMKARTRSLRSLILVVILCAIVVSIAAVGRSIRSGPDGGQNVTILPIALPKPDPAAQVHLRVAEALERLRRQERRTRG
jgi:hypothetical protein